MLIPINCFYIYILCVFIYYIYKLIPKATTKKSIQSDMLENTIYKYKWNFKKYPSNPEEGRREKQGTKKKQMTKWQT